jgi:hypothetical protein
MIEKGIFHLRRYFHLLVFQAYLDDRAPEEEDPYSFENFVKYRPGEPVSNPPNGVDEHHLSIQDVGKGATGSWPGRLDTYRSHGAGGWDGCKSRHLRQSHALTSQATGRSIASRSQSRWDDPVRSNSKPSCFNSNTNANTP